MGRLPIAVFASGRGSNLQSILDAAGDTSFPAEVSIVISDKHDAPALDRARHVGIESIWVDPLRKGARLVPEAEDRILSLLAKRNVRLIALAGFMRILSERFLARFPGRVINIHPSLLPSFPGLHAQSQALEHGVRVTGCTVHFVDEGIDTGPIVLQASVPVHYDDTVETLSTRILEQEHRIYPEAIRLIASGEISASKGT